MKNVKRVVVSTAVALAIAVPVTSMVMAKTQSCWDCPGSEMMFKEASSTPNSGRKKNPFEAKSARNDFMANLNAEDADEPVDKITQYRAELKSMGLYRAAEYDRQVIRLNRARVLHEAILDSMKEDTIKTLKMALDGQMLALNRDLNISNTDLLNDNVDLMGVKND